MTEDDALKTLGYVPSIQRVEKLSLAPTDVIVITSAKVMSEGAVERIRAFAQDVWPEHKVIVLDYGLTLHIVRVLPEVATDAITGP